MTENELLDLVRRELSSSDDATQADDKGARRRTAQRCRSCYAETEAGLACRRCGHANARMAPGAVVSCPEAGATDASTVFVVAVNGERKALLGPGGKLVLGRGENVDVWLEATVVSRKHVELVWDEGAAFPRFRDLGSANGTKHLGVVRGEGVLLDDDVITVGPYRVNLVREERAKPSEIVEAFDAGPQLEGPLGPGVAGHALVSLAMASRTGTFEVALLRGTGSIVLAGGRVVSARCGRTVGLAALHIILSSDRGAWRFRTTFELDEGEPIDMSVEAALSAVPW